MFLLTKILSSLSIFNIHNRNLLSQTELTLRGVSKKPSTNSNVKLSKWLINFLIKCKSDLKKMDQSV